MIHWFWYKTDGSLGGDHTMQGGWNPSIDLNNPNEPDEIAQLIRSEYTTKPGFAGFVSYEDGVSGQDWNQAAVEDVLRNYYVAGGALTAKPPYEIFVDGVEVADLANLDKAPGSTGTIKLVGASVADGTEVHGLKVTGPDILASYPGVFTFNGGESNEISYVAPLQGFTSTLFARPVVPATTVYRQVSIRGWS